MKRLWCMLFLVVSVCYAPDAQGQRGLTVAGDMGVGGLGGQAHATFQSGVEVQEGGLSLALFGRLRLAMQREASEPVLRERDWDEVTDFVHILRRFEYRRRFSRLAVRVRAGELLGYTLGHGSLIRDYSNIADPDHPDAGALFELRHRRFDVALMVDSFVRPSLLASRVAVRPLSKLERLVVGSSLVIDPRAPTSVRVAADGTRMRDAAFNLQTIDTTLVHVGSDLDYTFVSDAGAELTPYVDLNGIVHGGPGKRAAMGVHLGARGQLPLGDSGITLSAQAEYRAGGPGYAPAYVQTFHDIDRLQAVLAVAQPAASGNQTKLSAIANGGGGHGLLAQVGVDAGRRAQVKLGFSREPGPDANRLWMRVASTPFDRVNIGALLLVRGLGEMRDAAGVGVLGELRTRITDHLYALAQYSRLWALDEQRGTFGPLQSFNLALGGNWSG